MLKSAKVQKNHIVAKKRKKRTPNTDPSQLRINKVLAAAGLGSRRDVEELVLQGRVEVDREIVTDLAFRVNPSQSTIKVDGEILKQSRKVYYILNKPPGILSTNRDPSGRTRVIDLVPDQTRVFSVGRLDRSSEGLILLTNDGELAQRLAHPKYRIQKTYFVVVAGLMTKEELAKLRKGVHLAEGFAKIDGATIRRARKGCTELEIVLSEGKNREIRRILARAGHKVVLLRRIAIGTLRLGLLPVGASRELSSSEVKSLYAISKPKATKSATKKPVKKSAGPKSKVKPTATPLHTDEEFAFDDDEVLANFDESQFDESSMADQFGDGEFADVYDDDFVGGFESSPKTGSVIGADEPKPSRATKRKVPAKRKPIGRGAASTRKSAGQRTADGTSSTRSSGGRASAKTAATGRSKTSPARGGKGTKRASGRPTGTKSAGPRTSSSKSSGGKPSGGRGTGRAASKRSSPKRGAKSSPKGKRR